MPNTDDFDVERPLFAGEGNVRLRSSGKRFITEGADSKVTSKVTRKLPNLHSDDDPTWVKVTEGIVIVLTVIFAFYAYFYFDHLHLSVTHGYAKLGFSAAQHQIGQRYLYGTGVGKDDAHAMDWFKLAADQGHPHASYNLAIGHLKGIRTDILNVGEAHKLISHAASNGVAEAHRTLNEVCARGGCE